MVKRAWIFESLTGALRRDCRRPFWAVLLDQRSLVAVGGLRALQHGNSHSVESPELEVQNLATTCPPSAVCRRGPGGGGRHASRIGGNLSMVSFNGNGRGRKPGRRDKAVKRQSATPRMESLEDRVVMSTLPTLPEMIPARLAWKPTNDNIADVKNGPMAPAGALVPIYLEYHELRGVRWAGPEFQVVAGGAVWSELGPGEAADHDAGEPGGRDGVAARATTTRSARAW